MKRLSLMGAAAVLLSFGVAGCGNTAEGVSQDAAQNTRAVENAATAAGQEVKEGAQAAGKAVEKTAAEAGQAAAAAGKAVEQTAAAAGQEIKEGTKGASAALSLTPKVKTAILNDPKLKEMLGNTAYNVDVDSTEDKVVLKGTVSSNGMKKLAGEVATKAVKDASATQTVDNQLMVSSH